MGTHPIFESDFDCLTESLTIIVKNAPQLGTTSSNDCLTSPIVSRSILEGFARPREGFLHLRWQWCSSRSIFDYQGRTRSRRWRWCCRQEDPCPINLTLKTSYLLVPPTKHSRLIFSFFSALKIPQEQPLEYFALINLSKIKNT